MAKKEYRQVLLSSGDSELTCWLQVQPGVVKGNWITLKEMPEQHWQIVAVYNITIDHHPTKRWTVGGLG